MSERGFWPRAVDLTLTSEAIRAKVAARPDDERCCEGCPGWFVFEMDRDYGLEIEACDECNQYMRTSHPECVVYDEEFELLPEAQEALAKDLEAAHLAREASGEAHDYDTLIPWDWRGPNGEKPDERGE